MRDLMQQLADLMQILADDRLAFSAEPKPL
jgi:hypothetical protein